MMKIFSKLKVFTAMAVFLVGMTNSITYADALDDCVRILKSGTYTIKYENVTPPPRAAMHEKIIMFGGNEFLDMNPYTLYQPVTGIVVAKGQNSYVETNSVMKIPDISITDVMFGGIFGKKKDAEKKERDYEYASCKLKKNGELFIYTRITDKGKVQYVGKKKGKVVAVKIKKNFTGAYSIDFGDKEASRIFNAVMPDDNKVEGTVIYQRTGSGTLNNGMYYVDLKAKNPGNNAIFDAIRYYFQNGQLVKLEAGQYYKDSFGKMDGVRTIINIYEFKNGADDKIFKLPEELKDVTKRETKQEGVA